MNIPKFYDKLYDWLLRVGPKLLLAVLIFIVAQFLIRLLLLKPFRAGDTIIAQVRG